MKLRQKILLCTTSDDVYGTMPRCLYNRQTIHTPSVPLTSARLYYITLYMRDWVWGPRWGACLCLYIHKTFIRNGKWHICNGGTGKQHLPPPISASYLCQAVLYYTLYESNWGAPDRELACACTSLRHLSAIVIDTSAMVAQANTTSPISASYFCQAKLYYTLYESLSEGPQMRSLPMLVHP